MRTSGSNTSISGRKKMCCLCLITAPLLLVGTFKKFLVFHHRASKRRMFKRLIVFHLVFSAFIFDSLWLLYDALICAYFEARHCYSHIVSTALYICTVYAGKGFWGDLSPFAPWFGHMPVSTHQHALSPVIQQLQTALFTKIRTSSKRDWTVTRCILTPYQ